jgi:hypothetical protein
VAVTDATAHNGIDEIEFFRKLQLQLHVTLMVGADRLADTYPYGWTEGLLTVGHAKVMAAAEQVGGLIRDAHRRGWPAAVHVDEIDVLYAA